MASERRPLVELIEAWEAAGRPDAGEAMIDLWQALSENGRWFVSHRGKVYHPDRSTIYEDECIVDGEVREAAAIDAEES